MKQSIQTKAYRRLLEQAKQEYGENVDIRNIKINGSFSVHNLWVNSLAAAGSFFIGFALENFIGAITGVAGLAVAGNFQKITATGDVIPFDSQRRTRTNISNVTELENAISRVSNELISVLPERMSIAVISISSNNIEMSALAVDELEFRLVSARKFTIVDRKTLDTIRAEQDFQMSGDVSDSSAVAIGEMLGANIVITGSIAGIGTNQRLSIKALDVKTAQIITMVRETF